MTDREINEAIAETCGIKICRHPLRFGGPPCCNGITRPLDYCHDLNAMHDAEKALSHPHLCYVYQVELEKLLGIAGGMGRGNYDEWVWNASARQRAEAFLRTVGKWKEEAHT